MTRQELGDLRQNLGKRTVDWPVFRNSFNLRKCINTELTETVVFKTTVEGEFLSDRSLFLSRIDNKLGQGGAGDVCYAQDTNLKHPATIKVLPELFIPKTYTRGRTACEETRES